MDRELNVGSAIVFIDENRKKHAALVTHVWGVFPGPGGEGRQPGCNLLFVSDDESQTDNYGRQIQRRTSIVHLSGQPAGCSCWAWNDEAYEA